MTRLGAALYNFALGAANAVLWIFFILAMAFLCGYLFETGAGLARIHMGGTP